MAIARIQIKQDLIDHLQSVLLQLQDQEPKFSALSIVDAKDLAQNNKDDCFRKERINPL